MPRVSVLMSVLDPEPGYLREAVASVLDQTLDDLELVVLEDPAPRNAAAVLAERADPRVRHVRNQERVSLAESRCRLLELANADLVAIMDADDISASDRLAKQCAILASRPDVDVVGSQIAVIEHDGKPCGFRRYPLDHGAIVAAMRRYNPLAHPAVAMRKAAVLRAGGYRPCAGGTVDDYELWSRMARAGHKFANHAEALLRYRLHPRSMKSRLVHQTLDDTLWVKRRYWSAELGLRGHARIAGEKLLRRLPPAVVLALYRRLMIRPRLAPFAATPC